MLKNKKVKPSMKLSPKEEAFYFADFTFSGTTLGANMTDKVTKGQTLQSQADLLAIICTQPKFYNFDVDR